MFYKPDFFTYLQLLPVICLVVLPALFSAARVIIGAVKTLRTPELKESYNQEVLINA